MKIYEVSFEGMYPVPSGCIICANDDDEALKMAKETIKHKQTEEISVVECDISKPDVLFYESGDY